MPTWLNAVLTAVASGAVTGFAACMSAPGPLSWAHCGISAGAGAVVGLTNWFRQSPQGPRL